MSLYLPVRLKGSAAITVCPRCQMKHYYDDMVQDPNNQLWVCKDCQDIYDPWRLPARQTEDISLHHPRPDTDISVTGVIYWRTVYGGYATWLTISGGLAEWEQ